jgi:hypothetical protein
VKLIHEFRFESFTIDLSEVRRKLLTIEFDIDHVIARHRAEAELTRVDAEVCERKRTWG